MNDRELRTLHNSEAYAGRFNNDRRCIIYDKRKRCFILKHGSQSLPLMGVTTYMKKVYWGGDPKAVNRKGAPAKFDKSVYCTEAEALVLDASAKKYSANRSKTRASSTWQGMKRGTRVDNEIAKALFYYGEYKIMPWAFIDRGANLGMSVNVAAGDQRGMMSLQKNMHCYTRSVILALKNMGLKPFKCQVRVGSAALRLGTAVDIVCRRFGNQRIQDLTSDAKKVKESKFKGRNGVVIIELKCGYKDRYTSGTKMMVDECASLVNTPLNQHQLQLLATCKLFEITYGTSYYIEDAFVIRVDANGLYLYRLQDEIRALWPALRARLARTRKDAIAKKLASTKKPTKKKKKAPTKKRKKPTKKRKKAPTKKRKRTPAKKMKKAPVSDTDDDGDVMMIVSD